MGTLRDHACTKGVLRVRGVVGRGLKDLEVCPLPLELFIQWKRQINACLWNIHMKKLFIKQHKQ